MRGVAYSYGHAYVLHGKRWRFPNPIARDRLPGTVRFSAPPPSRLLFTRWLRRYWCRAPASRSRVCAAGGTTKRSGSRGEDNRGRVYAPDDQGEKVDVDLEAPRGAGGGARPRFASRTGSSAQDPGGHARGVSGRRHLDLRGGAVHGEGLHAGDARVAVEHQGVGDGVYFRDVHAHHVAGNTQDFNAKAPGVRVEVVPAVVVEVLVPGDGREFSAATGGIPLSPTSRNADEFSRFNSNTFDAPSLLSDRHADPVAEAYSHFTWAASPGNRRERRAGRPEWSTLHVTDPQIHTSTGRRFGCGIGNRRKIFAPSSPRAECRGTCAALGFPPLPRRKGPRPCLGFSLRPFFTRRHYPGAAASSKFRKRLTALVSAVVWPSRYAIAATRRLVPGRDAKNSYMT